MEKSIRDLVLEIIDGQKEEFSLSFVVSDDTAFIGDNSEFGSIELISFITEIEERFENEYGIDISLINEESLSIEKSPFLSLSKLVDFLHNFLLITLL